MEGIKEVLDTIVELSVKAVKAEDLAETYRVCMEKQRDEKEYWKRECDKLLKRLEKLEGKHNAEV